MCPYRCRNKLLAQFEAAHSTKSLLRLKGPLNRILATLPPPPPHTPSVVPDRPGVLPFVSGPGWAAAVLVAFNAGAKLAQLLLLLLLLMLWATFARVRLLQRFLLSGFCFCCCCCCQRRFCGLLPEPLQY